MRSCKRVLMTCVAIYTNVVLGQTANDMDWLQKSMDKSKQATQDMTSKGILEMYAPDAIEKKIAHYKDLSNKIGKQSNHVIVNELQANMGVSEEHAHVFSRNGQGTGHTIMPSLSAIFVSFSMSDRALVQAFEEADRVGAHVYFKGLHPNDKSITDTMKRIRAFMAASDAQPFSRFHPKAFTEFHVTGVPVMMHATSGNVVFVSGMLNFDWLKEQMDHTSGLTNLGKRGPTTPVIEQDIIKEMQGRMRGIDMESKKKAAIDGFWKKQEFVSIPNAQEDKIFYIDPTVKVQKDIVNPNGDVLARAGDVINPLKSAPSMNTYLMFNAKNREQIDWAKHHVNEIGYSGIVMLMTSELERDKGWEHLSQLRKEFRREIYMIPKEMVKRFFITGLPAMVTTDNDKHLLKIQQFVIGEQK